MLVIILLENHLLRVHHSADVVVNFHSTEICWAVTLFDRALTIMDVDNELLVLMLISANLMTLDDAHGWRSLPLAFTVLIILVLRYWRNDVGDYGNDRMGLLKIQLAFGPNVCLLNLHVAKLTGRFFVLNLGGPHLRVNANHIIEIRLSAGSFFLHLVLTGRPVK